MEKEGIAAGFGEQKGYLFIYSKGTSSKLSR